MCLLKKNISRLLERLKASDFTWKIFSLRVFLLAETILDSFYLRVAFIPKSYLLIY